MKLIRLSLFKLLLLSYMSSNAKTVCDYSKKVNSERFARTYLSIGQMVVIKYSVFNVQYTKPFILPDQSEGDLWAGAISGDQIDSSVPNGTVRSPHYGFEILCQFATQADRRDGLCTCYGYNL